MALWIGLGIAVAVVGALFVLAGVSRSGKAPGLVDGRLSPCPDKPNCVSSEAPADDARHHIEPLVAVGHDLPKLWAAARAAVEAFGGTVIQDDGASYLAAEFKSSWFGFVDDVELRLDRDRMRLHVRSASRVGHSDLGANRSRAQQLLRSIEERLR